MDVEKERQREVKVFPLLSSSEFFVRRSFTLVLPLPSFIAALSDREEKEIPWRTTNSLLRSNVCLYVQTSSFLEADSAVCAGTERLGGDLSHVFVVIKEVCVNLLRRNIC